MTMGLNIKNERVHDLVRQLAELTGQSQTSAIEDAVRRRLEEMRGDAEKERAERARRLDEIIEEFQHLPVVGPSYEEIMEDMYDERGLPR
ncbi:MAG: type II toxin-antitoxin system VapB family antitoxin [Actinobacteria bacterium]|nr:type II toxin-antitoxin system VapB family antitoxin [Actinomycetota bacterium]